MFVNSDLLQVSLQGNQIGRMCSEPLNQARSNILTTTHTQHTPRAVRHTPPQWEEQHQPYQPLT